jgi:hypothetical protein
MSTNGKIKVYKNPARNRPEALKPYVPQYQLRGVEPEEYKSPIAPGYHIAVQRTPNSTDSTRGPRPAIRQPYAEAVNSPVGRGKGPLPNVGNNLEQTWSSVDSEIVDDISGVDPDHPMVDNNDYVSAEALGVPDEELPTLDEVANPSQKHFTEDGAKSFLTEDVLQTALTSEYLSEVIKQLEEEQYLLMVNGDTICSGPLDYIQEQTGLLVFGEHELYHGNPVSVDDIIVIKRVKVKVGVFLI